MFIVEFYFRKWLVSLVLTIIRELVPDTQTFLFMFFLSFSVNARTTIPSRQSTSIDHQSERKRLSPCPIERKKFEIKDEITI